MSAQPEDLMERFLLGELSEAERAEVEERFLSDNEFFEQLLAAENSLLDDYVLGRLSAERRQAAETLFQSSGRQKRDVDVTKDMVNLLLQSETGRKQPDGPAEGFFKPGDDTKVGTTARPVPLLPAWFASLVPQFVTPGLIVLALICTLSITSVFYLYAQKKRLEAERAAIERHNQEIVARLQGEIAGRESLDRELSSERDKRNRAEQLVAQLQSRVSPTIASVVLTPAGFERGGNSKTITLKPDTTRIRMQLEFDDSRRYQQYSVLITTFEGGSVWRSNAIDPGKVTSGKITLTLPSATFKYGDYKIELRGLVDNENSVHIADYVFKVRR